MDLPTTLTQTLTLALWLGAPALAACLVAALLSAALQSAMHSNDSALSFIPRWLAVLAALYLGRELLATQLVDFTARILREMASVGT